MAACRALVHLRGLSMTYCRWALYGTSGTSTVVDAAVDVNHAGAVVTEATHNTEVAEVDRPTGWSLPTGKPAPPGVTPDVPFRVRRSRNQQLPVYSDYKNGRTRVLTKISKVDGDIIKMEAMLREYLQVENLHSKVDSLTGSIVLQGDHRVEVRRWLKSLGF